MVNIIKEQIILSENTLLSAIKDCNIDVLDSLLHEDLLFNLPNGITINKAMDMANYKSGNMIVSSILSSEQAINIIDDTAIVSVKIELKGNYSEQVIDGIFRYLRVWKLFNKDWKVIAGSCIQI